MTEPQTALRNLVAALDAIEAHPDWHNVWTIANAHGARYTGPTYKAELEAARAVLKDTPR